MISVVIPLYNKEESIASTLQAVLNQTFTDYEIVIVNDGSTDNSVAEVRKVQDDRIRLIHQQNAGVSAARNRGIEEAKGDLIAFLDADDEWKSEYLATQFQLYQEYPDCAVFACNYGFCDLNGNISLPTIRKLPFVVEKGRLSNYFEVASCSNPPICSISIMVKKEAIRAIGGFPIGVKSGEDLLTWARLAVNCKIAYSKSVLAIYKLGHSIPRPPEYQDVVGKELENIYHHSTHIKGLRRYVAYWYKMRMCRCLAHRMWTASWIAFFKSVWYNPLQIKIYVSVLKYIMIGLR